MYKLLVLPEIKICVLGELMIINQMLVKLTRYQCAPQIKVFIKQQTSFKQANIYPRIKINLFPSQMNNLANLE